LTYFPGFPLEFTPEKAGAGMTILNALIVESLNSGFKLLTPNSELLTLNPALLLMPPIPFLE
jgi:hypothetical protein